MKAYRTVNRGDSRSLAEYLTENGQLLLPMVELIEASRMAIDELIDVLGRASIEAVLQLSARGSPKRYGGCERKRLSEKCLCWCNLRVQSLTLEKVTRYHHIFLEIPGRPYLSHDDSIKVQGLLPCLFISHTASTVSTLAEAAPFLVEG